MYSVMQGRERRIQGHLKTPEADSLHTMIEIGLRNVVRQCIVDLIVCSQYHFNKTSQS
jgi:hypothetical protein